MALFSGVDAGPGRLPEGLRWDRAARGGAASGERCSRQKVNTRHGPRPPEIAGFVRPNLPDMTNKPLKTCGGWYEQALFCSSEKEAIERIRYNPLTFAKWHGAANVALGRPQRGPAQPGVATKTSAAGSRKTALR